MPPIHSRTMFFSSRHARYYNFPVTAQARFCGNFQYSYKRPVLPSRYPSVLAEHIGGHNYVYFKTGCNGWHRSGLDPAPAEGGEKSELFSTNSSRAGTPVFVHCHSARFADGLTQYHHPNGLTLILFFNHRLQTHWCQCHFCIACSEIDGGYPRPWPLGSDPCVVAICCNQWF